MNEKHVILGLTLDRPRIMGILNVTPDSFSDGGQFLSISAAVDRAVRMKEEGADIIDIGGESTRPGAEEISVGEELDRLLPVIEACRTGGIGPLSVDTRKADVMRAALAAGARMVNDVSALTFDAQSLPLLATTNAPIVLMHAQGPPQSMQKNPQYTDVIEDICTYLESRMNTCERAGIERSRIIVDPGIGFGKTFSHNLTILRNLTAFHRFGIPVLLGASRKSFIARLGGSDTADRLGGSLAAVALGHAAGIQIFRVHDVHETKQFLDMLAAVSR